VRPVLMSHRAVRRHRWRPGRSRWARDAGERRTRNVTTTGAHPPRPARPRRTARAAGDGPTIEIPVVAPRDDTTTRPNLRPALAWAAGPGRRSGRLLVDPRASAECLTTAS